MTAIYEWFINYLSTTPPDQLGVDILKYFAWFPIFSILIWGFIEVWLDAKQGQFWAKLEWDLLAVTIPQDSVQTPKGMMNFFNNLSGSKSAITWKEKWFWGKFQAYFTFEIVSNGGQIQYYIRCIKKYRDLVEAALYAQYPEAQIVEVEDYIDQIPNDFPHEDYDCFGTELKLSKDAMFPIRRYEDFEHVGEKDLRFKDPILPMLEMMGKMRPGEHYWIQLLIMGPDSQDWRKDSLKWMRKMYGIEEKKKKGLIESSVGWIPAGVLSQVTGVEIGADAESAGDDFRMWKMTPSEQDTLKAVNEKSKEIGWVSKIRMVYCAKKEVFRKGTIASMTKGIFLQYDSGMNKLGLTENVTTKDDYFWQEWQMPGRQRKIVSRYKNRLVSGGTTPYILSSSELATLWHFPPADARTPVLTSLGARMAEAPQELGFALDENSILPNIERTSPDVEDSIPVKPQSVETFVPESPVPTAPTGSPRPEPQITAPEPVKTTEVEGVLAPDQPTFQAGMPAPMPPGLDISDIEVTNQGTPDDLPI